jgi:hypothetical protein
MFFSVVRAAEPLKNTEEHATKEHIIRFIDRSRARPIP